MNIVLRRGNGERALMPFYSPLSLMRDIEELAQGMWDSWKPFDFANGLMPHTDIYEEKGELVVKTELPGITKKDLDVTLDGDRLTINAEKKKEVIEDATHHAQERYYGQYYRSVRLPFPVKEDEISAKLESGTLELRLPKAEEFKPKKIEIKSQLPKGKPKPRKNNPKKKDA